MKVDEDHSKLDDSPLEQEMWQCSLAEQHTLEVGKAANNATQKVACAANGHVHSGKETGTAGWED